MVSSPLKKQLESFNLSPSVLLLLLVALSIVLYVLTKIVWFGFAVFVLVIALLAIELFYSREEKGFSFSAKHLWREAAWAASLALALWFVVSFVLNTSTPLNVVTSCSMLPVLERGDWVFLQGGELNAPTIILNKNLSSITYKQVRLMDSVRNTFILMRLPFLEGKPLFESTYSDGCEKQFFDGDKNGGGRSQKTLCTEAVKIGGQTFSPSTAADIIVFNPDINGIGLIIHRVFLRIRAQDGVYYLTKGDNNPFLDQESGFALVKENPAASRILLNIPFTGFLSLDNRNNLRWVNDKDSQLKGKILFKIPFLGFLKLFVFGQFEEPAGCNYLINSP